MPLPSGFIDQMRSLLGEETDNFIHAMELPPVTSIRMNSRKPGASFPGAKPVKWCRCGYYLPHRPVFTLDPLLQSGAYYVQDASSMIYHEVICRLSERLQQETDCSTPLPLSLLDLCAAPGGKTTAMIDALPDGSRIVANEYVAKRAAILKENIAKWGYPDVVITNLDSSKFVANGDSFDIVAVDAPCSGEGMMRKESAAIQQWSTQLIDDCAALQKEILANAAETVKPGGYLIYSTCTFNRKENEENAQFIVSTLGLEPVDMKFPEEWNIPNGIDTDLPVYRFMPHITEGEGLFLSVFRKPGEWIHSKPRKKIDNVSTSKKITPVKSYKAYRPHPNLKSNSGEVPPIEQVLSVDFDRSMFPEAEVGLQQAVSYLRREAITLSDDIPKGLVVITYKGLPLGMAKNIGNRANNLYPKNWRILMQ